MKFEVLKNRQVVMSTTDVNCIYDDEILRSLKVAGYTFKINGKSATVKEVKSLQIADWFISFEITKAIFVPMPICVNIAWKVSIVPKSTWILVVRWTFFNV